MENSAQEDRGLIGHDPRSRGATTRTEGPPAPAAAGPALRRRAGTLRVLIAVEDRHRVYREAIGEFFRSARPDFDVREVSPRGLHTELRRFGPQVVVHGGPPTPIPDLLPCWVELSLDPALPTVLRTGRVRREVVNPSLGDLLGVIDEAAPVCP